MIRRGLGRQGFSLKIDDTGITSEQKEVVSFPSQEPEDRPKSGAVDDSSTDNVFSEMSLKSTPFAKLTFTKPRGRVEGNGYNKEENKKGAEEGLVEFLLRSGLFSVG